MFSGAKNPGIGVAGASLVAAVADIGAEGVEGCPAQRRDWLAEGGLRYSRRYRHLAHRMAGSELRQRSRIQVLVSLAAVVGVTGAVVWVNRMAYARIQQLENL